VRGPARFGAALVAGAPARAKGRDAYKEAVLHRVLAGLPVDRFEAQALEYGRALPSQFRPETLERIRWHQEEGHEVVLVSASLRAYLDPVVDHLGLDGVCAVEMEVAGDGRLTGRIVGANCRGAEKVRRLDQWLAGRPADRLWAYGNSSGDRELLDAAHVPVWVTARGLGAGRR
jgi:phosphatidylglycerophosphatase C